MDNTSDSSQKNSNPKDSFDFPTFVEQILRIGIALLVFGLVLIVLYKFTILIPPPIAPLPFLGGAIVLVALTFLGVPLIPAATAGVAVWLFVQDIFGNLH